MSDVIYEHPLNEKIRAYLRLEHLFEQINASHSFTHDYQPIAFFESLFSLIEIAERNDVRGDVIKDLEKNENKLVYWSQHPEVCNSSLQDLLKKVVTLQQQLQQMPKICNTLKEDKFLAGIRQRFTIPGGSCPFDLPQLHYWLHQPSAKRESDVNRWLEIISPINDAISIILSLARENSSFQPQVAINGFYQDSTEGLSLIRVKYNTEHGYYPTVSGNKYRYAIKFMNLTPNQERAGVDEDVEYFLATN